jgi:hypothetical protein
MITAPTGSFQVSRSLRTVIPATIETRGITYPTVVAMVAPAAAMIP